jgi:hypothetical protein
MAETDGRYNEFRSTLAGVTVTFSKPCGVGRTSMSIVVLAVPLTELRFTVTVRLISVTTAVYVVFRVPLASVVVYADPTVPLPSDVIETFASATGVPS